MIDVVAVQAQLGYRVPLLAPCSPTSAPPPRPTWARAKPRRPSRPSHDLQTSKSRLQGPFPRHTTQITPPNPSKSPIDEVTPSFSRNVRLMKGPSVHDKWLTDLPPARCAPVTADMKQYQHTPKPRNHLQLQKLLTSSRSQKVEVATLRRQVSSRGQPTLSRP